MRRWAKESDVLFLEFPQNGVIRRLAKRDGWAKRWQQRMAEAVTPAPTHLIPCGVDPGQLVPPSALFATRLTAEETLESFLAGGNFRYTSKMSSVVTARNSSSRFSEYLAWGLLSMRKVVQTRRIRAAQFAGERDIESKT